MFPETAGVADHFFEGVALALTREGYCVLPDALPVALLDALTLRMGPDAGLPFKPAGVGRSERFHLNTDTRTDSIHWLEVGPGAEGQYLAWMEQLRLALNARLYLGLFRVECHFARYAVGGYYRKHRDAFTGENNRILSTVTYLNRDWQADDGGELVLYDGDEGPEIARIVAEAGHMVVFLSERFAHEVLPARRERCSIAGWFSLR